MKEKKRNLLYALIALLFMVLLAAIGWLAYVFLSIQIEPRPASATAETPAPIPRQTTTHGPVTEVTIRLDDEPVPPPVTEEHSEPAAVAAAEPGQGAIPSICETLGPQVRTRDAFLNPLAHQTFISPTRITVVLDIKPDNP